MDSQRLKDSFPDLANLPAPVIAGSSKPPPSVLNKMDREQLIHLARAFNVLDRIPKDSPKPDLLEAMYPMERAGVFRQECEDPLELWFASKSRDELMDMKKGNIPFPTRDQLPLRSQKKMSEMALLHEKAQALGVKSFGRKKHEIEADIRAHEMGLYKTPTDLIQQG